MRRTTLPTASAAFDLPARPGARSGSTGLAMTEQSIPDFFTLEPQASRRMVRDAATAGPTAIEETTGAVWVLRYRDLEKFLLEPTLQGVGLSLFDITAITDGPLRDWYGALLYTNEGLAHHRLRSLVGKGVLATLGRESASRHCGDHRRAPGVGARGRRRRSRGGARRRADAGDVRPDRRAGGGRADLHRRGRCTRADLRVHDASADRSRHGLDQPVA